MLANQESAKQNGTHLIGDPLQTCVNNLVSAMKADFGNKFKIQFDSEPDALRQYKRRLYAKLRIHEIPAIMEAYEDFIETKPEWPPGVPDLCGFVKQAEKNIAQAAKNKIESDRVSALPPPKITECNPSKLLSEALSKASDKKDKAAWMARKAEALKNHEAALSLYGQKIKRRYAQSEHLCAVNGCYEAGALSTGTKGGNNWYCAQHFKTAV